MALGLLSPRLPMRSFLAAVYLLACSSAAFGQQITITVDGYATKVSTNDCNKRFQVAWTMTLPSVQVCSGPTFWITAANCGDAPVSPETALQPLPQGTDRQGTFTMVGPLSTFPGFSGVDGGPPCGGQFNLTHYVCGAVKYSSIGCGTSGDTTLRAAAPGIIEYRGKPPDPPQTPDLTALDSALQVGWGSPPADAVTIRVYLREAVAGVSFAPNVDVPATQSSVKVSGLQNGTTYEVYLTALDAAGNESNPSGTARGTPVASAGFFGTYQQEGGQEQGGCGGLIPGALSLPLILSGYRWLRRKRSCPRDS